MISFESSLSLQLFLGIILLLEKAVAKEEMDMLDKKHIINWDLTFER